MAYDRRWISFLLMNCVHDLHQFPYHSEPFCGWIDCTQWFNWSVPRREVLGETLAVDLSCDQGNSRLPATDEKTLNLDLIGSRIKVERRKLKYVTMVRERSYLVMIFITQCNPDFHQALDDQIIRDGAAWPHFRQQGFFLLPIAHFVRPDNKELQRTDAGALIPGHHASKGFDQDQAQSLQSRLFGGCWWPLSSVFRFHSKYW